MLACHASSVLRLRPRFELMAEAQRDLTPEQASARLRACSEVHFMDVEGADTEQGHNANSK